MNSLSKANRRPHEVTTAVILFWLNLALWTLTWILDSAHLTKIFETYDPVGLIISIFISFAFNIWVIYKISAGRNWARITYLVIFAIAIFPTSSNAISSLNYSLLIGILKILQVLFDLTAFYLIFLSPGKRWFKLKQSISAT